MWDEAQGARSTPPSPATTSEDHNADAVGRIGKSIKLKGEIRGTGDLYIDGLVEGTIELQGNRVTVGPEGRVQGDISARNLAVIGRLDGKARIADSTEIHALGTVEGEVSTAKISVAYGAVLHASIDVVKPEQDLTRSNANPVAKRQPDAPAPRKEAASDREATAELELTAS